MTKVRIQNNQESDVVLHIADKEGVPQQVTVPAAKIDGTGKVIAVGTSENVDRDLLEAGVKSNAVIRHYFDNELLEIVDAAEEQADEKTAAAAKGGTAKTSKK